MTADEYVMEWEWVAPNYILDKKEAKMWSIDICLEHISASTSDKVEMRYMYDPRWCACVMIRKVDMRYMYDPSWCACVMISKVDMRYMYDPRWWHREEYTVDIYCLLELNMLGVHGRWVIAGETKRGHDVRD